MTNAVSFITILTCQEKGKNATKKFSMGEDGKIKKLSFFAGKLFTYEELPVSNLVELGKIIDGLADQENRFVIRGCIKPNMPQIVRRKVHEPDAAFDAVARPYLMLDIDKMPCPDFFDPAKKPEEAIAWVQNQLPAPFRNVSCYYQFSASQNIVFNPTGKNCISVHLWYWCDRPILDEEWKRYFQATCSPVDLALFNAVQIHYTAKPVFQGMQDPLPKRSGLYKHACDVVSVPNISQPKIGVRSSQSKNEPFVSEESKMQALCILRLYYKEGARNRLSAAVAATLYRNGWKAENIADFIYQLAEDNSDSEANDRYKNVFRICEAVDNNRPVPGIPVLKDEFDVKEIDELLNLLGVRVPNIAEAIRGLNNQSDPADIQEVLALLLSCSKAQKQFHLDAIAKQTSYKKGALKSLLEELQSGGFEYGPQDHADSLMEILLNMEYQNGKTLLFTSDQSYWRYDGCIWEKVPSQEIKKSLLRHARELVSELEDGSVAMFNNAVMNILEGRVYREGDPLRQTNKEPLAIINCKNGELWFSEDGDTILRPHQPESYLRHCLDVNFDPDAKSPLFDKAVLEIFANSSDPEDMFRHFMELAGYICQPWRKFPIIVLFYGGGSNGKTSLVKIIRRMLGNNTVMSDRISDIEGNVFKIGDLDGKLLLLDDDVDGGTCLPDGFLKKISEEKAMTGQHKHKPPFEFICRAVPVMLANDYPVTKDLSLGLRRRLRVIPFNRTFEALQTKVDLFDEIWEKESSGILNHVIAGFQRLKKRGRFQEPKDCVEAKEEWIKRANVLTTFIAEECLEGEKYTLDLNVFYRAFTEYCQEAGIRNMQGRRGVESRLDSLGYKIGILHGSKAIWGLCLRSSLVRESVKSTPQF